MCLGRAGLSPLAEVGRDISGCSTASSGPSRRCARKMVLAACLCNWQIMSAVVCRLPSCAVLPAGRDEIRGVDTADNEIISYCCVFFCCVYHMKMPVWEAPAACFLQLRELSSTTGQLSPGFGPCSLSAVKEIWWSGASVPESCTGESKPVLSIWYISPIQNSFQK